MTARDGKGTPAVSATALDELDIASSLPVGVTPVGLTPETGSPVRALEQACLTAVRRAPCAVSFSGGRDSSLVLATAVRVARREGLPDPVPVTLVVPEAPASAEAEWQELVVRSLRLTEWVRLVLPIEELELLGPRGTRVLLDAGLLYPPNAYLHEPIAEAVPGGSLLTGMDGDGLMDGFRRATAPRRAILAVTPKAVVRHRARRLARPTAWLEPTARERWVAGAAAADSVRPRRWDRWLGWYAGQRYLPLAISALDAVGRMHGAVVRHPLLDRPLLAALAAAGRRRGLGGRRDLLALLADGDLPPALLARKSKAQFDEVIWGPATRAWVAQDAEWSVPMVDAERLREEWRRDVPDARSCLPLQAAWLSSRLSTASRANDTPTAPRVAPTT
ncbi:MAG TPA: asparagine synthase-related protein [Mycobacteriales bacterium]|nr:asparagine synthase-related protein [Mycobacteriales bacterium]